MLSDIKKKRDLEDALLSRERMLSSAGKRSELNEIKNDTKGIKNEVGYMNGYGDKGEVYSKLLGAALGQNNEWQKKADSAANTYMNMNYNDFLKSDDYASLAKRYSEMGNDAMQDTLGTIAARTGGIASSYATAAASQQYNDYMTRLEDAARSMYQGNLSEAAGKADLARTMANDAYGKNQDYANWLYTLDNQEYERAWNEEDRAYGRVWNEDERAYNRAWNEEGRAYERAWNEEDRAYEHAEQEETEAKQYVLEYISMTGSLDGIDPEKVAASGYDEAYLNAIVNRAKNSLESETMLSLSEALSLYQAGYSSPKIDEALNYYLGEGIEEPTQIEQPAVKKDPYSTTKPVLTQPQAQKLYDGGTRNKKVLYAMQYYGAIDYSAEDYLGVYELAKQYANVGSEDILINILADAVGLIGKAGVKDIINVFYGDRIITIGGKTYLENEIEKVM